jgi:sugar/nucleoside kinase (ribokinase family)
VNSASPILIVGSMAFDDLQLPSVTATDVVGGSATYSAFAASIFAPVRVVGVVGDDFPARTLELMRSHGIDTEGVEHASGRTFRWAGRYDADLVGRTTLDTQLNVFAHFQPKIPASYRTTPLVLLGNIHPALQLDVLNQVERPRLVVADTMNFWIQGEPKILAEMLRRVDLLVINDEEARMLSGIHSIRRAADDVRKRGPRSVIIKRGEHGALLFDEDGIFAAPAYPLHEVIDPTGAGDCFAGGLLGYIATAPDLSGLSMRRAMVHATATASYCVEAVGTARVAEIHMADVKERVAAICRLYDFGASTM